MGKRMRFHVNNYSCLSNLGPISFHFQLVMDLPTVLILVNADPMLNVRCNVLTNTTGGYVDSKVNYMFCF